MEKQEIEKIKNYLNQMIKEGKIKDWHYGKYNYWNDVRFLDFDNGHIALCFQKLVKGDLCMTQIENLNTFEAAKKYIDLAIDNQELICDCAICDLSELKEYIKAYSKNV